jgi:hypothetical protein
MSPLAFAILAGIGLLLIGGLVWLLVFRAERTCDGCGMPESFCQCPD